MTAALSAGTEAVVPKEEAGASRDCVAIPLVIEPGHRPQGSECRARGNRDRAAAP